MCRIDGPFKHHSKYRLRVVDRETGKTTRYTYETEQAALDAIPLLRAEYRRPTGVTMQTALEAYAGYLATERQNRPGTIETTIGRIRSLFTDGDQLTDDLTKTEVERYGRAELSRGVVPDQLICGLVPIELSRDRITLQTTL